MTFDKLRSPGYLSNHVARLFAQGLDRRIRPLGIAHGQFPALLALWERDGLTQKELVESLDVEQATMANTLARMERDGLIRRTRHPADARAQQVWLTEKAIALKAPALAAARDQNAVALSDLSAEEREMFVGLLSRVMRTMRDQRG